MKRSILFSMIFIFVFSMFYGCASKGEIKKDSGIWMKEGITYFSKKKYQKAAEAFENAVKEAETPEIAAQSQLLLGDSYFMMKDYEQAIPSYKEYLNIYKNSSDSERALYRLGMSYYNQIDSIDRDQGNTEEALKFFMELKTSYPTFYNSNSVDKKVVEMREMLAKKELYIAKFYFRTKHVDSAEKRFLYLITNYKDSTVYAEALARYISIISKKAGKEEEAVNYLNELSKLPQSKKYMSDISDSLKNIQKNLQSREN